MLTAIFVIVTLLIHLYSVSFFHNDYRLLYFLKKQSYFTKRFSHIRMQPNWMSLQYFFIYYYRKKIPFLVLPLHKLNTINFSIKKKFNFGKLYLKKRTHRIKEPITQRAEKLHHKPSLWQAAQFLASGRMLRHHWWFPICFHQN